MAGDHPVPTDFHAIALDMKPLPANIQNKLLEIWGEEMHRDVPPDLMEGVSRAIEFARAVNAVEKKAPTEASARDELASLAKALRSFVAAFDALTPSAWGRLSVWLHARSGAGPNFYGASQIQSTIGQFDPNISETADLQQWEARATAPAMRAIDGAKALLAELDALLANLKPPRGNRVESGPRLLANELARLLRAYPPIELTIYENGSFARIYRACYAVAFGVHVAEDPPRDFRHYLRDAIAGTKRGPPPVERHFCSVRGDTPMRRAALGSR